MLFAGFLTKRCRFCSTASSAGSPPTASIRPKVARALADALSVLAPIKESLLAKDYAVQIAGRVRAREQDVLDQLAKLEAPSQNARTAP